MKRWLSLLVAMVMLLSLGVSALAAPAPKDQQIARYNNGTEPETIDPAKSTGIPEANIEINVFEGLTRLGPGDVPVPGVAYKWDISKDGLVYTFKLRKSKWSNGDPVTAHDFEYAWKRALAPETASEYAYQLYYIKNGEEYNSGKIKDASQVGVKALDDYTLQVTLKEPTPFFLSLCAFPTLMPVHKKFVEADPKGWFQKPETYIGNGPFKMAKWEHQSKIELVKSPTYWDAKNVKLEKVIITLVEAASTEQTMFETNQLDIYDNIALPEVERWKKDPGAKFDPMLGTYYYIVNCENPKLKDKRVRQALFLAIDRETICEKILKAGQKPAYAWTPYGFPDVKKGTDYRTVGGNKFITTGDFKKDVEKAKKLLAEAGYPDGKGLSLEILYNTSEGHKKIAEAIQQMWKQHLGIEVKLTNQEWKVYLQSRDTGSFEIARAGWIGDYVHPMTFMDMMVTGGGNNDSFWGNAKYDELIKKAKNSVDPKVSFAAMHEAEAILMEEMPILPIYFYTNLNVYKPWIKGVQYSALGFVDFKTAWIEKH
ncbi:MAG: peptide ABC transporter substrate-binding protein [Bacillota bacterium]|nr:peptide ABC transporter substrate-binding protein [Bacillota bacterium]